MPGIVQRVSGSRQRCADEWVFTSRGSFPTELPRSKSRRNATPAAYCRSPKYDIEAASKWLSWLVMSVFPKNRQSSAENSARFVSTRWSIVNDARRKTTAVSRRALAELCEVYWYPLYAFICRRGLNSEDARDMTQEFFAELLEK